MIVQCICGILLFLLPGGCTSLPFPESPGSFVVFYGRGRYQTLRKYDLLIIQSNTLTPLEIRRLKRQGKIVCAYLSLGEGEPWREWWSLVEPELILARNPRWGSSIMDVSRPGWRALLLERIIPALVASGFNGLFLDTIDVIDLYPRLKGPMVTLIRDIHRAFPDLYLIQNRGYAVLEETAPCLSGILLESMCTGFNFETRTYLESFTPELYGRITALSSQYGLVIFSLDYADPADEAARIRILRIAGEQGFIPYISTILLDAIYPYTLPE